MLRKISHIFLFVLLFFTTTGLVISKHFCKEVFISSSVYLEAENCCEKECCQNQSEFLQLDEEFQVSEITQLPTFYDFGNLLLGAGFFFISDQQTDRQFFTVENDPPPLEVHTRLSLKQTYLL